jgi:hypothetical protein
MRDKKHDARLQTEQRTDRVFRLFLSGGLLVILLILLRLLFVLWRPIPDLSIGPISHCPLMGASLGLVDPLASWIGRC